MPTKKTAVNSKSTKSTKPTAASKRAAESRQRLLALAQSATSNAMRTDTRTPDKTRIPFGAPVTATQIAAVEKHLKSRDILKTLKCTERQLRDFSRNEISFSQLPAPTQSAIRVFNASPNYSKPWSRKTATILYTLLRDRATKKRAPKQPKPVEPKLDTPAVAETTSA